ncbi:hypothetical protein CsSME_00018037 [Camellia sinensis var. sinensis]
MRRPKKKHSRRSLRVFARWSRMFWATELRRLLCLIVSWTHPAVW